MVPLNLMIQFVSGVVGGNAASSALRPSNPGTARSSLLGALGGICCAQLPGLGEPGSTSLDLFSMAVDMSCGFAGGGVLVVVACFIRSRYRTS